MGTSLFWTFTVDCAFVVGFGWLGVWFLCAWFGRFFNGYGMSLCWSGLAVAGTMGMYGNIEVGALFCCF